MANRPRHRIGRVAPRRDRHASDSGASRQVIVTLHMCEMIEEEYVSRNKVMYSLKNAA